MTEYVTAHGIKLFKKKCSGRKCTAVFWVPKSSKQEFCSDYCRLSGHPRVDNEINKPKRKRRISYKVTKEDYE